MLYGILCALLAAGLVALDQLVKYWVQANIPVNTHVPFIPGLLDLTHVHNTGGAFSALADLTWLLTLISAVMVVLFTVLLLRRWVRHPLGVIPLVVVTAGAAGNLIDRVRLGYVVDMFATTFMDFAVFNVADICIVGGAVLGAVYYLWFYEKYDKKGISHGNPDAASES